MLTRFSAAVDYVLDHPRIWAGALFATFAAMGALKFLTITILYVRGAGAHPLALRMQDSIIDGTLAAAVVWLLLSLARERRRQVQKNLQAIADLHERLQNVLYDVVEIKDEASDEDIESFLHTLDGTASSLREMMRSHVTR